MEPRELIKGDVVQLGPRTANPGFAYCFLIVDQPKGFGAQSYVHCVGRRDQPAGSGGLAFYRAAWEDMTYIGKAAYIIDL